MAKYHRSQLLSYACACALGLAVSNAYAQTTAQSGPAKPPESLSLEEVVVTGSFIPTLPENAAIPVDVISYEDMKNLGKPSNMDLIKNLSEAGQSVGELDRNNAYPVDAATINLRNLGSRYTTVVFNNRRFPEQFSPAVGRFNNIASIPNAVIGNIEVLRSGGAAIYGADAVAGVVNYLTRKNVRGLELNAEYRFIPDSDGDYNVDGIWGKEIGGGDFMVGASYQHRSKLERRDRPFSNKTYLENPASWTSFSNPGAYAIQSAAGAPIAYGGTRQRAATSGVVRDPSCQPMGGYSGLSTTGSPICYGSYAYIEPLVEESDQFSVYAEFNKEIAGMDFHMEGFGYYRELPDVSVLTRIGPLTFPMSGTAVGGFYDRRLISTLPAFSATGANPAARYFLESMFLEPNGTPGYSAPNIDAFTGATPGVVGLITSLWVPFGAGGNPLGKNYDHQRNTTTQWRMTSSLGGEVPSFLGTSFDWEVALTYHYTRDTRWTRDIPAHKLQNALNGFGGPDCTGFAPMTGATSPVSAGSPGCYFFNPFSSAYATNIYTGAINPYFKGDGTYLGYMPGMGLQNNPAMIAWLYESVSLKREYFNTIVDPIIRGGTGLEMPGGEIRMAFGGQFRRQDEHVDISDNVDRSINPCPWLPNGTRTTAPGFNDADKRFNIVTSAATGTSTACTGMMTFSKSTTVLGSQANNHRDEKRHYPVAATFLQFQLPILDDLNADIVGRYERFFSDVTNIDNDVFVPALAVKWDVTDWVALRTSYGETFSQVNPPKDAGPTPASVTVGTAGVYGTFNYPNLAVKPESGENFSVGFIFNSGNFRATLDYTNIKIKDYARTLTSGDLLAKLVLPGELTTNNNALLDCSSPLLSEVIPAFRNQPFVTLSDSGGGNAGCVQGSRATSTPGSQIANTATVVGGVTTGTTGVGPQLVTGSINFFGGNRQVNAGELVTSTLDASFSYSFDALGGRIMPTVSGTYVTRYQLDDFIVAGVKIADGYDGVGFDNSSDGREGLAVAEYRLTFGLLYNISKHTVNLSGRYIPSVVNEDRNDFSATTSRNANIGPNSTCPASLVPSMTSHVGHYPAGAGTAEFGATCAGYNVATLAGGKISSYFNLDLVYRMQLTDSVDLSLNVVNILDTEPSFSRAQLNYDSGYGSPLGRTIEISASAKF